MNPYFEVGEEVILCSKGRPEFNGEYMVKEVLSGKEKHEHIIAAGHNPIFSTEGFFYDLGFLIAETGYYEDYHWAESALRKKHKPSTDSFTEMMSNIDELVTQ